MSIDSLLSAPATRPLRILVYRDWKTVKQACDRSGVQIVDVKDLLERGMAEGAVAAITNALGTQLEAGASVTEVAERLVERPDARFLIGRVPDSDLNAVFSRFCGFGKAIDESGWSARPPALLLALDRTRAHIVDALSPDESSVFTFADPSALAFPDDVRAAIWFVRPNKWSDAVEDLTKAFRSGSLESEDLAVLQEWPPIDSGMSARIEHSAVYLRGFINEGASLSVQSRRAWASQFFGLELDRLTSVTGSVNSCRALAQWILPPSMRNVQALRARCLGTGANFAIPDSSGPIGTLLECDELWDRIRSSLPSSLVTSLGRSIVVSLDDANARTLPNVIPPETIARYQLVLALESATRLRNRMAHGVFPPVADWVQRAERVAVYIGLVLLTCLDAVWPAAQDKPCSCQLAPTDPPSSGWLPSKNTQLATLATAKGFASAVVRHHYGRSGGK